MQHDGLTHRIALRIEGFLHTQRATMAIFAQHRAFAGKGKTKMQLGVPAGRMLRQRYGEARSHARIIRESLSLREYAGMRSGGQHLFSQSPRQFQQLPAVFQAFKETLRNS